MVVGAATGYGSAIMARLSGSVIAVEARTNLVEKAQETLVEHGIDNAAVIKSRLVDGYAAEAPYDCILVEGGVEFIPERLLQQLCPKGKLAAIYRPQSSPIGVASLWTRSGKMFVRTPLFDACVPNLDEFNKNPNLFLENGLLSAMSILFTCKPVIVAIAVCYVCFSPLPLDGNVSTGRYSRQS